MSWIKKAFFGALAAFGLSFGALAEGETASITIDSSSASSIGTAITGYVGEILPVLLSIIGAGLGIALLFWVVRLLLRGAKASSK